MALPSRLARILVPSVAIAIVIVVQIVYFDRGFVPGDAFTYLAAGERLNDGHLLYALSPGDRPVGLKPPYWTVPLLSPPPIAVLFRPFALLPNDIGPYVWWAICITAIVGTILVMLRREPIVVGLAVIVLCIPIVYEIGVGNLNALLVAAIPAAWLAFARRRDLLAGGLIAAITALKLTPVVLAWWLLTQRRWGAVKSFGVTGIAIGLVSIVGAGLGPHLEYIGIVRQTSTTGTSDLSLAGVARHIGVDPGTAALLPTAALLVGLGVVWLLRDRPGPAFATAVVTMLVGSPVVNINWFTILLTALAPVVWPLRSVADDGGALDSEGPGRSTSDRVSIGRASGPEPHLKRRLRQDHDGVRPST